MRRPPELPESMVMHYTEVGEGRIRSRRLGEPAAGMPPVVVVQGMAVSDYLLPACAALADWTQTHLVDLPGYAGSGPATRRLDVRGYGEAVAHWLEARGLRDVVLVGHSSGTQVAAWAALLGVDRVRGLGLASPTVDPIARSWLRLLVRWRLDGRHPTPGLQESHAPEWKRAGPRGIAHLVKAHLADRLEDQIARQSVPVLIIRANQDRLSTPAWTQRLRRLASDGELAEVEGPHAFTWTDPPAWVPALRRLAGRPDGERP